MVLGGARPASLDAPARRLLRLRVRRRRSRGSGGRASTTRSWPSGAWTGRSSCCAPTTTWPSASSTGRSRGAARSIEAPTRRPGASIGWPRSGRAPWARSARGAWALRRSPPSIKAPRPRPATSRRPRLARRHLPLRRAFPGPLCSHVCRPRRSPLPARRGPAPHTLAIGLHPGDGLRGAGGLHRAGVGVDLRGQPARCGHGGAYFRLRHPNVIVRP